MSNLGKSFFSVIFLVILSVNCHGAAPLTVTYGAAYKPFAWGEHDTTFGIQRDFVDEILTKRMGIEVKHETCPWKRCQKLVMNGERDAFFTVPTKERATYTTATKLPFYTTRFVMHTGKKNKHLPDLYSIKRLADLERMHDIIHVHMHGSGWHENALQNMKRVTTNVSANQIPLMLAHGRADLYIEQKEMLEYQARQIGVYGELVTIDRPTIRTLGWHFFISKDSSFQSLMPKINAKLEALKESGELAEIKREVFARYGIEAE